MRVSGMAVSKSDSIGTRINKLFLGAVCVGFSVTLVVACVLLRVDSKNSEFRSAVRVKALLDAQLPLFASDLLRHSEAAMRTRLDGIVATHSLSQMEAAILDQRGARLASSHGFAAVSNGIRPWPPQPGEYVTPNGYVASVKAIRSDREPLGEAIFAVRLQPVSSRVIGQSLAAYLLVLLIVLSVLFISTQRYVMHTVVNPIETLIRQLPALNKYVESVQSPIPPPPKFRAEEFRALTDALWEAHVNLKTTLYKEQELRLASVQKEARLRLSAQVAHDIRSPLTALDIIVEKIQTIEEPKRLLIRRAVSRIADIANNLVQAERREPGAGIVVGNHSVELLSGIVEPMVSEKRVLFSSRPAIEIELYIFENGHSLFCRIIPGELRTIISNLINNAVEAMDGGGKVTVALSAEKNSALLRIVDNGKGIPQGELGKLGTYGFTSGKPEGSGRGLYHAKAAIVAWNGTLEISSELGQGTCVEIRLPLVTAPPWFATEVALPVPGCAVILDDEPTVHEAWKERLSSVASKSTIELYHLYDPVGFGDWIKTGAVGKNCLYLMDYELIGHTETGLDLIEKFGLQAQSLLVSARYEEPMLRDRCFRAGVKLLPKGLVPSVPVVFQA